MIIKALIEDTSTSKELHTEPGLSLYIETKKHKVLFDTGESSQFAENAEKLGVDLKAVDLVIISHGHYDHAGGLPTFLSINDKAKVYLHRDAFDEYYASRADGTIEYIGIPKDLTPDERFVLCEDRLVIDEDLELFSGVNGKKYLPSGNSTLYKKVGESLQLDNFSHEQNLIISENGNTLLISGCSHNGIVNIVEHFQGLKGFLPDFVIGGFHLSNPGIHKGEKPEIVDAVGKYLLGTGSQCYTCHCTGIESYERLKAVMGDKINYLSAGTQLEI